MTRISLGALVFAFFFTFGCNVKDSSKREAKYSIISCLDPENLGSEFYFETKSLVNGELINEKLSTEVNAVIFSHKGGYYYGIDYASEDLIKFQSRDGRLDEIKRIHLDKEKIWRKVSSWFSWVNKDTLLICSSMSGKQFVYCVVDANTMKLTSNGNLNIPLPGKNLNYGGIFGTLRDNKIYISYTLYDYWNKSKPAPSDTTYLAKIGFPDMKTESIKVDSRSTFPGGYILSDSFGLDYEDDIFLITQTGGRTREHPWAPNAIFKIKANQSEFDKDYFFIVADKKKEEAYGLYNIGEGMAITKVIEKADIGETSDYLNKAVVQYYLLDLVHKTRKKIPLPKDILDFRSNILVDGERIFIGVYNPSKKNSAIWELDKVSLSVKRGIVVPGHVLQIFRINLE